MNTAAGSGDRRVTVSLEAGVEDRVETERQELRAGSEDPFAILVVGDFRGVGEGAPSGSLPPFHDRTPLAVDRDDLDDVLASLAPSVRIPGSESAPEQRVDFRSLDDFHPDRLLERAPILRALRQERSRPGRSQGGSGEGRGREHLESSGPEVLDRILASEPGGQSAGGSGGTGRDPLEVASDLDSFLRRITRPHEVPDRDPSEDARLEALDRETTVQLRRLLHDARFQALEARWRGLHLLVRRLETGPDLKVFVLQADPAELLHAAEGDALATLLERTSGELLEGAPWAAVMLDHAFGAHPRELAALQGLAQAGRSTGAAFVAEADPGLLGMGDASGQAEDEAGAWTGLRGHPGAAHVGLLLPRFLARLPYAEGENPCENLDFQELEEGRPPSPGQLLWAHPGFLAVLLLGTGFRRNGWGLRAGAPDRIDGLPLALHRGEEGVTALPTTEVLLDGSEVQGLMEAGFIPVGAQPGEGTARLLGFRSVSADGEPLRGPW